jgi:hypothetical protein
VESREKSRKLQTLRCSCFKVHPFFLKRAGFSKKEDRGQPHNLIRMFVSGLPFFRLFHDLRKDDLLQLRILRLGLLQDGDVGISIFPEGEKVFIGSLCLGGVACHRVRTS